jgi:hypothetical protein
MSLVIPALKRLYSPDVFDLESFSPADPTCFSFLLHAMFGPKDGDGEESFDVLICTPGWLAGEVERSGVVNGRHHLIVRTFDIEQIRSFLVGYASTCTGRTWQEVAGKLSRLGKWEFEDFKP